MQEKKENKEYSVLVLLSTYNGEKYLREQLDTIFSQKNCRVTLLVRDDGSTDATRVILKEYQNGSYGGQIISVDEGTNIGVIHSFFTLLHKAAEFSCDYYALADQDDIWQEDKLFAAVSMLEERAEMAWSEGKRELPYLYASAVQPVDEKGRDIPAGIHYAKITPAFGNALVENMCTGCTCVMNRELLLLLQQRMPEFTVMHDFWLYLVASAFGEVIYDTQAHILYRQHGGNSLGMASSMVENYKRRIRNFKKHRGQLKRQAAELQRLYGGKLEEESREKARLLREFIAGRRGLIFDRCIYRQRKSDDVIMKLFLLLGCL